MLKMKRINPFIFWDDWFEGLKRFVDEKINSYESKQDVLYDEALDVLKEIKEQWLN